MIFEQLIHNDLGCAAYLVGCQQANEAVVIDPPLDIRPLEAALTHHNARLVGVIETHTHADHVSGHGILALELGVPIWVSPIAEVAFASRPMPDGTSIHVGNIELVAVHTPGHRPEHTALQVIDHTRSDEPWLVLTGDSLFVGDVARPDLAVASQEGAADLYHSLQERLLTMQDGVEVFPGHVAGSLCGKGMSAKPSSTLGFERRFNDMLQPMGEDAFVVAANAGLAPKPPNLARIVEYNHGPLVPRPVPPQQLTELPSDVPLLDVRATMDAMHSLVAGSYHVPADQNGFGTRAGFLLDPDVPTVLIAEDEAQALRAARRLQAIGHLTQRGWILASDARGTTVLQPLTIEEFLNERDSVQIVDVRADDELPAPLVGAIQIPLTSLHDAALDALDPTRRTAVICQSSQRAGIGASILAQRGFGDVHPVLGAGMGSSQLAGVS
ncbi:MAG: MBL fold metallo-hydrolase [Thermoleophilia bacterium]|nr:MBL fold metallo-hydrolase [Thermoleophilia bacterium]